MQFGEYIWLAGDATMVVSVYRVVGDVLKELHAQITFLLVDTGIGFVCFHCTHAARMEPYWHF